jgi:hypothetical protein
LEYEAKILYTHNVAIALYTRLEWNESLSMLFWGLNSFKGANEWMMGEKRDEKYQKITLNGNVNVKRSGNSSNSHR